MIITNSTQGRITQQGSDTLGRWAYVRLATKRDNMIYIIVAYKPCKSTLRQSGPTTFFRQQWISLRNQGNLNPQPRNQFDKDLLKFVEEITNQGHRCILVGDFNETRTTSKLFPKLLQLGLRDAVLHRHSPTPPFRSCNRGTNTIDFAFCSVSLLPSLTAATYEPFQLNIASDHRGIILDFNSKQLLGTHDPIVPAPHRIVQSTNDDKSELFLDKLQELWTKHNITERTTIAEHLQDKNKLRKMLNEIDQDITKVLLEAEQTVARRQRPHWSPALKEASLLVKVLKLKLMEFTRKQSNQTTINHTIQQIQRPEEVPWPTSQQECQQHLRKAQKRLRNIRKHSTTHRTEHLETLIAKHQLTGDKTAERIVRRILKAETIKQCYRKLRWILHPPKPGVTFVQQQTPDGNTTTLYNRQELETAILQRNRKHFNQCAGTPFTVGKLRRIKWAADSKLADDILEGQHHRKYTTHDRAIATVLNECKRLSPEIPMKISRTNLKSLFKHWRESTTTSPSGRHLGLYKAIYKNESENALQIADDMAKIVNMALQQGLGLDRWRQVTNMMIHKQEGSYLLNKLRVIHLFEADYNGVIGILFNRKLLYHAEQQQLLNDNQWGCRPHRQAEDALMLKELTYNMTQMTKTTLATFDNDATGCFDRVPCSIAMLTSRRLGAAKQPCQLQADTLKHVRHQLCTAFGISEKAYESNDSFEIHGQGQGSRAGPPTWVFRIFTAA